MPSSIYVTNNEYILADDATLMSITDPHSYITYANDCFAETSGFTADELLNQPHNIVRHPDMPKQVFADMWATLKKGESWSGLVKNRRKNGDFYWVRANAMPIMRNHNIVGFMSIRTKASREDIVRTDLAYQRMNQGNMQHSIHRGLLVPHRLRNFFKAPKMMPLRWRIRSTFMFLFGILAISFNLTTLPLQERFLLCAVNLVGFSLACFWLEKQLAGPVEKLCHQALTLATGDNHQVTPLSRMDEIGIAHGAINQLGLMFRWLVNDVTRQLPQIQKDARQRYLSDPQGQARAMQPGDNPPLSSADKSSPPKPDPAAISDKRAREDAVNAMEHIRESVKQIDNMTALIDNIAFQTNILALNAAVGLPRKQSQDERRRLRLLTDMTSQLCPDTAAPFADDNAPYDPVYSNDSHQAILDMVTRLNGITPLISDISTATALQAEALNELMHAFEILKQCKQQNKTQMEKAAQMTALIEQQKTRLADAIAAFR